MLTYYFIRVHQDDGTFHEYDVTTALGDVAARTIAFIMDGGVGAEYPDDDGVEALALTYTDIISQNIV